MKRSLVLLSAFVFFIQITLAQSIKNKEVKALIDTTIIIMQHHAVNANAVNWAELKAELYQKASNLNSPYEMGDVVRYLYKSLNDFHGEFRYGDSTFKWHGKEVIVPDSIQEQFNKKAGIKTALLGDDIGYIRVPSMSFAVRKDLDKKAQSLNDSLCALLVHPIKGLILDLRINGGGAMFPMILGLEQLLDKGKVGSFQSKKEENWYVRDNGFYVDTTILTSIVPKLNINATVIPIVILTSPVTGSSGEFLIIAFKSRKNTILLGSKTAGYVTATEGFIINKMAYALLSTGYGKDRNGKGYKNAIEPDIVLTTVDKFNDLKNDEKVKSAISWIKLHSD